MEQTNLVVQINGNERDFVSHGMYANSSVGSTPTGTLDKRRYKKPLNLAHPHSLKDFLQSFSAYDKRLEISNEFNRLELEDDNHHVKVFERCLNQNPEMDR